MIGLDTNVLIRYIVQDDPIQSEWASQFIEHNCTTTSPGFINQIVLCEIVWVMKRAYGYDKRIITDVLHQLLITQEFIIEESEIVWQALQAFEDSDADFSDMLLGVSNKTTGCKYTITFDKNASKSELFKLLD